MRTRLLGLIVFVIAQGLSVQPSTALLEIRCGTGQTSLGYAGTVLDFSSLARQPTDPPNVFDQFEQPAAPNPFSRFVEIVERARTECRDLSHTAVEVWISGEIGSEDADVLDRLVDFREGRSGFNLNGVTVFSSFTVNSVGGDVYAAMRIGDSLFRSRSSVIVVGQCFSACMLAVAGAVSRLYSPSVQVGSHRIYLPGEATTTAESSADDLAGVYEQHFGRIQIYLTKYGISDALLNAMRATPSSQIRTFSKPELDEMGLGGDNVAYEELKRTLIERNCGERVFRQYVGLEQGIEAACGKVDADTCQLLIQGVVEKQNAIEEGCVK